MQTALNGVSASTDQLTTLLDASTQIQNGIAQLDAGAAQLDEQVSYDAYKAILKENGLDLDQLKDGNAKAMEQLEHVPLQTRSTCPWVISTVKKPFMASVSTWISGNPRLPPKERWARLAAILGLLPTKSDSSRSSHGFRQVIGRKRSTILRRAMPKNGFPALSSTASMPSY